MLKIKSVVQKFQFYQVQRYWDKTRYWKDWRYSITDELKDDLHWRYENDETTGGIQNVLFIKQFFLYEKGHQFYKRESKFRNY